MAAPLPTRRYPLDHCPECKSLRIEPVVEAATGDVRFLCRNCDRCWHVELGMVQRMSPYACNGCPQRTRCRAVYDAEHGNVTFGQIMPPERSYLSKR